MSRPVVQRAAIVSALVPIACAGQGSPPSLAHYDVESAGVHFDLPGRLDEVSGLAMTPDGRLFAHADEEATVHEILLPAGDMGKRFSLGRPSEPGDFEGIAIVGERFFLVTSGGLLYEFREGGDRESVPFRRTDTGLGAQCEVEGLEYDPLDEVLLVACKTTAPERSALVVHRLPMDSATPPRPQILIARGALRARGLPDDFEPSAIAVTPDNTLLIASASAEALIEVDRTGRLISGVRLSERRHPQSEGLAFGLDGALYVADEANDDDARLTVYPRLATTRSER